MVLTLISRRPLVARAAAALVGLLALSACVHSAPGANGRLTVVASFYPIALAAERVGGRLVSVTNLTTPGVEPHDLELTPRQLGEIATADVVLYVGGGFQPAMQDAIGDAQGETVDVSAGLRRLPAGDGSDPTLTADPHVWLDPVSYADMVDTIAGALGRTDRASVSTFSSNARVFEDELAQLDADFRTGLADCERDLIVTSHAAFGYLAARYGLRQEAISGLSPDAEPNPQRLADLRTLVLQGGVTTIFTEELVPPQVAETLARETGASTAVLDPLESLPDDEIEAGDDYLSVMRSNLARLEAALGCR